MGLYKSEAPQTAPRNIGQETRDTLQAYIDLSDDLYATEAENRPRYAQLDAQTARDLLLGTGDTPGLAQTFADLQPTIDQLEADSRSYDRERDIQDYRELAPEFVEARRALDPEATAILDQITSMANEGLANPELTGWERKQLGQSIRGAQAARGMGFGDSDAFAESIYALEGARDKRGRRINEGLAALGASQSFLGDPLMAITGRSSGSTPGGGALLGQGLNTQRTAGPTQVDPFNSYASNLFGGNHQAALQTNLQTSRNRSALSSALVGGLMPSVGFNFGGGG